jgi:hypothetical protein
MDHQYVERVIDLTRAEKNIIYNMSHEQAVAILKSGDADAVRKIDGQFALLSVDGKTIRMARSIGRPLRYFIAKRAAGPNLVVAERIDEIYDYPRMIRQPLEKYISAPCTMKLKSGSVAMPLQGRLALVFLQVLTADPFLS